MAFCFVHTNFGSKSVLFFMKTSLIKQRNEMNYTAFPQQSTYLESTDKCIISDSSSEGTVLS